MSCVPTPIAAAEPLPAGSGAALPEIRVREVSSYGAFLNLEPVWTQVVNKAAQGNPFLEFAWARTWWDCFGKNDALNILVLWEGDEPIAIAPLMAASIRMWGCSVRTLGFLYNAHVPRSDFIIAKRHQEAYRAIWSHLARDRRWDLLQLFQVPESSPTVGHMRSLAEGQGHHTGTWRSGASPYVPLTTSLLEYQESLAAKHRANLRNRFKRLNLIGPVVVETITAPAELPGALEEAFQLEAAAWKGTAGTAISCAPISAPSTATSPSERRSEAGFASISCAPEASAWLATIHFATANRFSL